ncbi:hypothetical protein E2C01_084828 [Portunus trituberculatus]|uniref:Uncharacterized protein n=1 Tax=Portunus trituberculatus TaxID=210409 RepID=A0A5B7J796_PORTR|nr:hypothetical protein [Portunus trituberculatus]
MERPVLEESVGRKYPVIGGLFSVISFRNTTFDSDLMPPHLSHDLKPEVMQIFSLNITILKGKRAFRTPNNGESKDLTKVILCISVKFGIICLNSINQKHLQFETQRNVCEC